MHKSSEWFFPYLKVGGDELLRIEKIGEEISLDAFSRAMNNLFFPRLLLIWVFNSLFDCIAFNNLSFCAII